MSRTAIAFSVLFVAAFGSACGDESSSPASADAGVDASRGDAGDVDSGATADTGPILPPPIEPPNTPVGTALRWLLDEMNGDGFSDPEIQAHFSATLLQSLPVEQLRLVLEDRIRVMAPVRLASTNSDASDRQLTAQVVGLHGLWYRIQLSVDSGTPALIDGLFFVLAPELDPNRAGDWETFAAGLGSQARDVNFMAAEITRGSCDSIAGLNSDVALAAGSTFKLYVLAALAQDIVDGNRTWQDQLAIQTGHKSLPSGEMHLERPGRSFALQTFAEKMISISDNTAADHLLYELGRGWVETIQEQAGHAKPSLNIPFLATREFFVLKLLSSDTDRQRYLDSDPAGRRQILDEEIALVDVFDVLEQGIRWTNPLFIEELEWFMSAADACQAMLALHVLSEKPAGAPVASVLSLNPGASFDPGRWVYTGYKGGAEPGVLNLTWLLQRDDGRWFVLTLGFNDPDRLIVTDYGLYQAGIAALLLAQEE